MKIGFIGAGNMGGALARAAAKCEGASLFIYDADEAKAKALADCTHGNVIDSIEIARTCDLIFLGVKPNIVPAVADEIKGSLSKSATVVSMAAGVKLCDLSAMLDTDNIIRIMPNTPAAVGMGMILYAPYGGVGEAECSAFLSAMNAAGELRELDESQIDAGTAVSGCGPAFVYMFIDAMAKGGEAVGLSYEDSLALASATVMGAAKMVMTQDKTPERLRIEVCSPGGSTIEGVKSLMQDDLQGLVMKAVEASYRRTKELGK